MQKTLTDERFDFVSARDKEFIVAFDDAITAAGYEGSGIVPYVCLGKYKVEYGKAGLKNKKIVARFYFRDEGLAFRLCFSNIAKHREYIENAPEFIKDPFVNDSGKCKQCDKNGGGIGKKGHCSFKKSYIIDSVLHEKCAGESYYFDHHSKEDIPQYIALLSTFYPERKHAQ